MGKFTGVLLCSDYDNTIVNTLAVMRGEREVSKPGEATLAALNYFMEEGGTFAVATGRAYAAFVAHAGEVPMNAPAVLYNGAALYDFSTRQFLETVYLDEVALERFQQVLERWKDIGAEAYNNAMEIPTVQPNDIIRRHQHMVHTGRQEYTSLTEIPGPVTKVLMEGDRAALEAALQEMLSQPWSDSYEIFFSGETLLELTVRGANKGTMVARLAQRLGISMEHVYCVGDETNDLSMLQIAKEGFAPANCAKVVRDSGVTIVSDVDHDALADIIKRLDTYYA